VKGYVYILKDQKNKYYIGSTSDVARRMRQHYSKHTQTTRNMIQPLLVLTQEYKTIEIARKIEKKIKNLKRKDYIKKMIVDGSIKIEI